MSSHNAQPILVTGATGKQGGATVHALLAHGIPVRALVRDTQRAGTLRDLDVELVEGDLLDPSSVERAVHGTRGVFSVQMPAMGPHGVDFDSEITQAANLIDAAVAAGISQFVQSTVSGAGPHTEAPGWDDGDWGMTAESLAAKAEVQKRVRAAGFDRWTILKPGTFMENFLPSAAYMFPRGLDGGLVTTLKPDTTLSLVAVEDIGRAAAAAFADPDVFHQVELELASDFRSMTEVANTLSDVLDTPIAAPDMTEDQAVAAGMPAMGASHKWLNAFGQPARPEYAQAMGIETTSFQRWAERNLGTT